ncbi:alanyl-tRNA editing protein [Coprothermobacter platensis]|uniref:alanyl-tRNA editing protein n=1 Tax=Coprothermobacter platensis TaxID=108819 RepID=UPI000360AA70|nr:alanyl-tRNA editing protein [Coprothermobacter platensis]
MKGKILTYDSERKMFQLEADVYEGGGGQPADRIRVAGPQFSIESRTTVKSKEDGNVFWVIEKQEGDVVKGDVDVFIDELWRLEVSQQHTAQHIFSALAEDLYGWPSEGFSIFDDDSKIELLGADDDMTKYEQLEKRVNEVIAERIPVHIYEGDGTEHLRKPTKVLHPRIVDIEGIDKCACGGTHVQNTADIGGFALLKVERKNTRYVRVIFASGLRLGRIAKKYVTKEQQLKNILSGDIKERIQQILDQKRQLEYDKKNLLEMIKQYISESSQVRWQNLPLDMQSMKQIASYCGEIEKNIVLINEEGYFAIAGPDSDTYFQELREQGANGGGKGVITGKIPLSNG